MINNDLLRSIRYTLNVNDTKIAEIVRLAGLNVDNTIIADFLKKEDDVGYKDCPDEVMAHFFNGLILFRRGKDERFPAPLVEISMNNNISLKKLRIAFELKDTDMQDIFTLVEFPVSKPELNALFRKEGGKNYRPCGDQLLRYFLKGLTLWVRGSRQDQHTIKDAVTNKIINCVFQKGYRD